MNFLSVSIKFVTKTYTFLIAFFFYLDLMDFFNREGARKDKRETVTHHFERIWNPAISIKNTGAPLLGTHYIVSCDAEVCGAERESSRIIQGRMHRSLKLYLHRGFACRIIVTASRLPPRLTVEYKRMYNVCVVRSSFLYVPQTPNGRDLQKWTKEKERICIKHSRNSMELKKKIKSGVLKHDILHEFEISKSIYYRFIVREHVLLLTNMPNLKFLLIMFMF